MKKIKTRILQNSYIYYIIDIIKTRILQNSNTYYIIDIHFPNLIHLVSEFIDFVLMVLSSVDFW